MMMTTTTESSGLSDEVYLYVYIGGLGGMIVVTLVSGFMLAKVCCAGILLFSLLKVHSIPS